VRVHGAVTDIPAAGAHDHVCWVYRDDADLAAAAIGFLAGGQARGERLMCVGDRVADALRRSSGALGDIEGLTADGALRIMTLAEAYAAAGGFTPEGQHAFYDDATRRALAEGYTGLRVFADVTPLAMAPGTASGLVRWEHLADDLIAHGSGMSAMCAYSDDVPASTLADVGGVHPLVHAPAGTVPFRVFFDDDDGLALAGDVDTLSAGRLAHILASTSTSGRTRALDLSDLRFADVAACRVIARWARTLAGPGVVLELDNAPPLLERMWHVLMLDEWAPVAFSPTA
jgi:ABC-type transporter Mla MlaB component